MKWGSVSHPIPRYLPWTVLFKFYLFVRINAVRQHSTYAGINTFLIWHTTWMIVPKFIDNSITFHHVKRYLNWIHVHLSHFEHLIWCTCIKRCKKRLHMCNSTYLTGDVLRKFEISSSCSRKMKSRNHIHKI